MKKYETARIDIIYMHQNVLTVSVENDELYGKGYFIEDLD
jgi:hypothetical protein